MATLEFARINQYTEAAIGRPRAPSLFVSNRHPTGSGTVPKHTRCQVTQTRRISNPLAATLLAIGLAACGDQMVVEGIDPETGKPVSGEAAQVDDQGDGTSNEGGPVDMEADLHEAAIDDEQNMGPNAPGYIP